MSEERKVAYRAKGRHGTWRDAAHLYIKENGPQTADSLINNVQTKWGYRFKTTPLSRSISMLLQKDSRFVRRKRGARIVGIYGSSYHADLWGVRE
tara:strand:+ start:6930 stop:7214 length:285 start_codon:yes stop_codon:yes gene_type:complete